MFVRIVNMPSPVVQSVASLIADREFDPGPASYFCGDCEIFSQNILFLPLIQEGLLSVTSESMCMEYWLIA